MVWHLADIFESVAASLPDAPAISYRGQTWSWRDYEARASRCATVFRDAGLDIGDKLAIYSYNHPAWLEAQLGAFKARLTPVNVNYRYLEDELVHVITNSDSRALVFQAQFAPRIAAIRDRLPEVKLFLEVDDGSGEHLDGAIAYEGALAAAAPMPRIERSGDDVYMLYTGGTTGMPKGVMYRHEDFSRGLLSIGFAMRGMTPPEDASDFGPGAKQVFEAGGSPRSIPACPLMHGTGMWIGAMVPHGLGGSVVLFDNSHFDADAMWQLAADEAVTDVTIVGDVFARPLLAALDRARDAGTPYRLDAMRMMGSSGVMWSKEVKAALLDHLDIIIVDAMGSTEGSMGSSSVSRATLDQDATAKFQMNPTTKVFDDDDKEVVPGSGQIGRIANGGMVPIGYYKDPEKSAATFRDVGGQRFSFPGDFATVEADGTITLLGRGSVCINSGGEKIFPEEVEEIIKTHPAVYDCLVVGVPDERFGERVTAVLSLRGAAGVDADALAEHVKAKLAGYKVPRTVLTVDAVPRADNGKPNYKAAKAMALDMLGIASA